MVLGQFASAAARDESDFINLGESATSREDECCFSSKSSAQFSGRNDDAHVAALEQKIMAVDLRMSR